MCGINGFIRLPGRGDVKFDKEKMRRTVSAMNGRIVHRGPDAEGLYADERCALGMRRLSIIDIAGGSQPVWNEDHTVMVIYNGEIYNFRGLRKRLIEKGHAFSTESDTEVLVHGYEEWGEAVAAHLEGMFAFCIYDMARQRWILGRDRIGEKPLHLAKAKGAFLFASELKSLSETGLIEKTIDTRALSIFLRLTYIPAPYCIYEGVEKLMPGTTMTIYSDGQTEVKRYWDPSVLGQNGLITDYGEAKRRLRRTLYSSVKRRMVSDVPLGAFLSGGIDSTVVTGLMSRISDSPVNTFTIGFKEKRYDESHLAALTAAKHHTSHRRLVLDWDEVFEDLHTLLGNMDEPFADSSLIATYAVSRLARRHVTVTLTGDAGDELFAGYNKYLGSYYGNMYKRLPGFVKKGIAGPVISQLPASSALRRMADKVADAAEMDEASQVIYYMSLGFSEEQAGRLLPWDDGHALDFVRMQYHELNEADSQCRNQYVDLRTVLEGDMLAKVDRASMLASLETRVPMLDYHVVELAFSLPTEFKIKGRRRKIILKEAFRDLIPEELLHAKKMGFGVPVGDWLSGGLLDKLRGYADRERLCDQGLFDAGYINGMIEEHISGKRDHYSRLWSFFVFQDWYEREQIG